MGEIKKSFDVMVRRLFFHGQVLGDYNMQVECLNKAFEAVTVSTTLSVFSFCLWFVTNVLPLLFCSFLLAGHFYALSLAF